MAVPCICAGTRLMTSTPKEGKTSEQPAPVNAHPSQASSPLEAVQSTICPQISTSKETVATFMPPILSGKFPKKARTRTKAQPKKTHGNASMRPIVVEKIEGNEGADHREADIMQRHCRTVFPDHAHHTGEGQPFARTGRHFFNRGVQNKCQQRTQDGQNPHRHESPLFIGNQAERCPDGQCGKDGHSVPGHDPSGFLRTQQGNSPGQGPCQKLAFAEAHN